MSKYEDAARTHMVDAELASRNGQRETAWLELQLAKLELGFAEVEQARLANLIALADHAVERFHNAAGEAGGLGSLFSYGETPYSNMRLRDDVREALGLSDG